MNQNNSQWWIKQIDETVNKAALLKIKKLLKNYYFNVLESESIYEAIQLKEKSLKEKK